MVRSGLTVMDSELFDIPVTKAGERWNQPVDWREGIYGGTGYYEFSPVSYTHLDVYKRQDYWQERMY